jgi:co-chaperonin GroES (HSP10)
MKLNEDKVLLTIEKNKTAGGIFIPSVGNLGYKECKVMAVGPGRYNPYVDKVIPVDIKVGDRVLVNQGVLAELPISKNGTKITYYVVPASECVGPLDDDETI